jgi:hypothetical protein
MDHDEPGAEPPLGRIAPKLAIPVQVSPPNFPGSLPSRNAPMKTTCELTGWARARTTRTEGRAAPRTVARAAVGRDTAERHSIVLDGLD